MSDRRRYTKSEAKKAGNELYWSLLSTGNRSKVSREIGETMTIIKEGKFVAEQSSSEDITSRQCGLSVTAIENHTPWWRSGMDIFPSAKKNWILLLLPYYSMANGFLMSKYTWHKIWGKQDAFGMPPVPGDTKKQKALLELCSLVWQKKSRLHGTTLVGVDALQETYIVLFPVPGR